MKNKILKTLGTLVLGASLSFNSYGQIIGKNGIIIDKDERIVDRIAYEEMFFERDSIDATKVITNNKELKQIALSITKDCPINDKECKAIKIFEYVCKNYIYQNDNNNLLKRLELGYEYYAKSPQTTIKEGMGNCLDLTILNNSLLENINIKTKIASTEDHAYGFVCELSPKKIKNKFKEENEIPSSIIINQDTCICADLTRSKYLGWGNDKSDIEKIVNIIDSKTKKKEYISQYLVVYAKGKYILK